MPNVINGTSTGSGGLITSGDDSGILNIQTNETTAITVDASQVVTFAKQPAGTFAGTGPAFSAYPNAGQVIVSGTYTKLLFQTEEFDTNNNFASSTFTPTVAGYYQVTVGFVAPSVSRAAEVQLLFYKNAAAFKTGTDLVTASTIISTMSALIYLNGTTDYLDCYVYLGTGGTTIPSASTLYFQAAMVRSA